jgi:hypothetical protein
VRRRGSSTSGGMSGWRSLEGDVGGPLGVAEQVDVGSPKLCLSEGRLLHFRSSALCLLFT